MTTASATSVVLLRILLEIRFGLKPVYTSFDQGVNDPFGTVDAMLFIGDHALRTKPKDDYRFLYDLGRLWHGSRVCPSYSPCGRSTTKKILIRTLAMLYHTLRGQKNTDCLTSPNWPGNTPSISGFRSSCLPTTGPHSAMICPSTKRRVSWHTMATPPNWASSGPVSQS